MYEIKLTIQFGKIGGVKKVISGGGQEGGGIEPGDQRINTFSCSDKKKDTKVRSSKKDFL